MFDNMGFTYLGPVDGHDTEALIELLQKARRMKRPVLIHTVTQKGKGYPHSEEHPKLFHGIGKFDPVTGEPVSKKGQSFSDAFGEVMVDLAGENDRVCAITAAMPGGTGLLDFKKNYPKRLFDVGIAEEHAVSMAGGLAKQGMIPVVALYSTFLQRAYDMILQDICMLGLHVVFAVDRAGLVGEDGETHHGVFDIGMLRHAPGMRILCPASLAELKSMMTWAVNEYDGPVAVRYPRGGGLSAEVSACEAQNTFCCHRFGGDVVIITYGTMLKNVMSAAEKLAEAGVEATVLRLLCVSPLPVAALQEALTGAKQVFVVEETLTSCGISQALCAELKDHNIRAIDLGDGFIPHGAPEKLYDHCGLSAEKITNRILEVR